MQPQAALRRSIARHGVISFLAQAAALLAVFAGYRMPWPRFALYLGVSAAYHGLLTGLLIARSADFTVEGSSGVVLPRVNLATSLTFVRLSSIPTVMFLVIQAARYPLLPVVLPAISIVFLTDLLDGLAARRRHQVTFVGRYLDSTSDYLMIIAVSVLFFYFRLIPAWFFALIMSRLVLFAAGMAVLTLKQGKADPLATFLGKASVFATMVLYVLELAEHFRLPVLGYPPVVRIVEYLTAAVIVASVVDKVIFLARMFAAASRGSGHKGAGPGSL
jgi:cardiolipin synthase (CMP-forming)